METRALLWLRALAYDGQLHRRGPGELALLVLHRPRNPTSVACAETLAAELVKLAATTVVAGSRFTAATAAYGGPAGLSADLQRTRAVSLFVCPGLEDELTAIAEQTRRSSVLSVCGERAGAEAGLGIALVNRGLRAGLLVNLAAAKAEGAEFDARLLKLAEVLR